MSHKSMLKGYINAWQENGKSHVLISIVLLWLDGETEDYKKIIRAKIKEVQMKFWIMEKIRLYHAWEIGY